MVNCGLTVCTPGSAPGPTLSIEYLYLASLGTNIRQPAQGEWHAVPQGSGSGSGKNEVQWVMCHGWGQCLEFPSVLCPWLVG